MAASLLVPNPFLDQLADEHRTWLSAFNPQYLRNWEKLLNGDYEAGMCEASIRRLLQRHGVRVEPNEDLTGSTQAPDFRCYSPAGDFFVEVACIPIEKASEHTGLSHPNEPGSSNYASLNDAIFNICKPKAKQCRDLSSPALVAIGTFHASAAALCFRRLFANWLLTGEANISWMVDTRTGEGVGDTFQTTGLEAAPFLRPENAEIAEARKPISGLLLCSVGFDPVKALGILHPAAVRPFDVRCLPQIEFGELRLDRVNGLLTPVWPGGNEEESDEQVLEGFL